MGQNRAELLTSLSSDISGLNYLQEEASGGTAFVLLGSVERKHLSEHIVADRSGAAGASMSLREPALVSAVAKGDSAAFERLYDLYSPTIYGLLLKMCEDEEDANDLLQETFVQCWQKASSFDRSRGSEIAWLITIARSRAIDRLRARRTRAVRESEASDESRHHFPSVDMSSVTQTAELHQARQIVVRALEELPVEQRRVIELAYFKGQSHTEIAATLGAPLGSVKTRIQLAMKKLRTALAPLMK